LLRAIVTIKSDAKVISLGITVHSLGVLEVPTLNGGECLFTLSRYP